MSDVGAPVAAPLHTAALLQHMQAIQDELERWLAARVHAPVTRLSSFVIVAAHDARRFRAQLEEIQRVAERP